MRKRRYLFAALALCALALLVAYWRTIVLVVTGLAIWRVLYRAVLPQSGARHRHGGVEGVRKWIDTGAIALIAANTYPAKRLPASLQRRVKARGARA